MQWEKRCLMWGSVFGFLLTAIYVPGMSGTATTPKWALLAVGLPLFLFWRPIRVTLPLLVMAALLAWSAVSLAWTPNRYDGLAELIQYAILFQAFLLGSAEEDLGPIFRGMACGLVLSSLVLFAQLWWPEIVLRSTTHSGLYVNSGALAEAAALVLIAMVGMRQWRLAICILPCLVMPESRGAYLGVLAAFIAWLWGKSRFAALGLMLVAFVAVNVSLHLGFHVLSVIERLHMWRDAIGGLTWLGHGVGSVWTDYAFLNQTFDIVLQRPEHLHNDWLELLFEGGLPAILLSGVLVSCLCFAGSDALSRAVLAGFVAESFVGFPLHMPTTGFIAALCLGHLVRGRVDLRDLFADGRILLPWRRAYSRPGAVGSA